MVLAVVETAKISILIAAFFVLAILAGLLLLIIIMAVISLPVSVYLRYYSLDFLSLNHPRPSFTPAGSAKHWTRRARRPRRALRYDCRSTKWQKRFDNFLKE